MLGSWCHSFGGNIPFLAKCNDTVKSSLSFNNGSCFHSSEGILPLLAKWIAVV